MDIRGRRYIKILPGFVSGKNCRLEALDLLPGSAPFMSLGKNVEINDRVHITAVKSVSIGNNVLIASSVLITDVNHGSYSGNQQDSPETPPSDRLLHSREIIIEDNVWIGEGACILPGVKIGRGTIVGANAVVTKSLPPYSIAVGNPARIIKKFNFEINKWISS